MRIIVRYLSRQRMRLLHYLNSSNDANSRSSLLPVTFTSPWLVAGASVTGHGHRSQNLPCQDAHLIRTYDNGWGVAVVSDGAGSAGKSHLASAFLVREAAHRAGKLVEQKGWAEKSTLPGDDEWQQEGSRLMERLHQEILGRSENWNIPLRELHATLILVIFSPLGLLVVHRGDGRAGCADMQGRHHALLTPWEGEQAGQTVFVTTGSNLSDRITGTMRFAAPVKSFFLLTDGCERVCWEFLQRNGSTGSYDKLNRPFEPFFTQTIEALQRMQVSMSPESIAGSWYSYLDSGHKGFKEEQDDKTMVIGLMMNNGGPV
jgi:hypothetical protein